MKRCIAEALGTYILVFAGTGAIVIDGVTGGRVTHVGIALTFGLVVMALVAALGAISGAHINPAATLASVLSGRLRWSAMPGYVVAQVTGAIAASATLAAMFGPVNALGATLPSGDPWQAFFLEIFLTFVLMFVALAAGDAQSATGVPVAVAVGATVGLEAMFAGPISGASMNPARSLGPALISGNLTALWVYLLAPMAGAALAATIYRFLRPATPEPSAAPPAA